MPPAVEAGSLNRRNTREVPPAPDLNIFNFQKLRCNSSLKCIQCGPILFACYPNSIANQRLTYSRGNVM